MGWPSTRDEGSSSDVGDDGATPSSPPSRLPARVRRQRNFSETEFMDSGLAHSFVPSGVPTMSELKANDYDERFFEEIVLTKMQEVQRRLQLVRERKEAILGEIDGKSVPVVAKGARKYRSTERLFVASNRLPLSIEVDDAGEVTTSVPTMELGLISAFRDLLEAVPIRWLGAPGRSSLDFESMDEGQRAKLKSHFAKRAPTQSLSLLKYVPIFPPVEDALSHATFCNSVIWPLFHYMPLSFEGERTFQVDAYKSYVRTNQYYADCLVEEWKLSGIDQEDAMFWLHDCHLLLVPRMLRKRLPNARIGYFLHTPFPAGEVFRTFPERRAILEGHARRRSRGLPYVRLRASFLIGLRTHSRPGRQAEWRGRQGAVRPRWYLSIRH
eukprot:IDg11453t1